MLALDGLTFTVQPGQLFGFVGPNGAGKTTAMRIVLGVLAPDAGEVRWQGRPIDDAARAQFGYMPEERGLYAKMRVDEQLAYFAQLHGADARGAQAMAERWMRRVGVAGRGRDRVESLSLGNQQRVQFAAALVHDPVALVLDEPFSGLDPVGVDVMSEVLAARARDGVPVLFSSHHLELVERVCDAVAIIKDGRLMASGAVAELRGGAAHGMWRMEVLGAPADWPAAVPGVEIVQRRGDEVLVRLADGGDDQALLDAARAAGAVRRFQPATPSLAELFREAVVAADAEPARQEQSA
ncbi:MAG: ATP-binding cassette domain-containing protein [Actinomycetota bacterium]|nr:ATP-binding cassette domain-containing protein [Actinomycetota bacterium]